MMSERSLIIILFVLALILVAVVELVARREESTVPTLGDLCGFIMNFYVESLPIGRIGLFGLWWWLGWHFFAR
jgi:hypothetical protein